ncbi:MAG TPA: hypothetical protein VFI65_31880 [Streptosporangiaceae bacterium]|nr:hypothetical protein [Streptosporangiaceae bacterium]
MVEAAEVLVSVGRALLPGWLPMPSGAVRRGSASFPVWAVTWGASAAARSAGPALVAVAVACSASISRVRPRLASVSSRSRVL